MVIFKLKLQSKVFRRIIIFCFIACILLICLTINAKRVQNNKLFLPTVRTNHVTYGCLALTAFGITWDLIITATKTNVDDNINGLR